MIISSCPSGALLRSAAVGAVAATLLVAGCSTSTSSTSGGSTSGPGPSSQGHLGRGGGGYGPGARRPGVVGTIAEVDGKTLQVQSSTSQTAVTWDAGTVFTQQVVGTASALHTGVCVLVRPDATGASPSATAGTTSGTVTAADVSVLPATHGSCDSGFGAGGLHGAGRPSGMPSAAPSAGPGAGPGAGAGGMPGTRTGGGFARAVAGTVSATSSDGFTVRTTAPGAGGSASTRTVDVRTSASTRWTVRRSATGADAKVGLCADAQGSTDSTGAMTASRIALSSPVDGSCTVGGSRG